MKILKITGLTILLIIYALFLITIPESNITTDEETLQMTVKSTIKPTIESTIKPTIESTVKPTIESILKLSELQQLQNCMINTANVKEKEGFDGYIVVPKDEQITTMFYKAYMGNKEELKYCNILIESQRKLSETISKPIYLVNTVNENNAIIICDNGKVTYNWLNE